MALRKTLWWSLLLWGPLVLGGLVAFSWPALDRPDREHNALSNLLRFASEFFPPDWSVLPTVMKSFLETLRISILSTLGAVFIALPFSILVSERYGPSKIRSLCLLTMTFIRSIPSLVWALLAVSVFGPWPIAGVIALCFYSLGYLIKFFADALDSLDASAPQQLITEGSHPIQAIQYGIWPQWRPHVLKKTLWMFEYNIRSASIIGYVGAGGLGTLLHSYQEFYLWDRFSVVMFIILLTVVILEWLSRKTQKWGWTS